MVSSEEVGPSSEYAARIRRKASAAAAQINRDRESILLAQRSATLLPILGIYKWANQFDPTQKKVLQLVFNRVPFKDVRPMLIQRVSFVISLIYEDPKVLVEAAIGCYGQPKFDLLAFSVIPSVYGFFFSSEYCAVAMNFFAELISSADFEVASKILTPFLCSSLSFHFLSSAMESFFSHSLSPNSLYSCIKSSFKCLPREFSQIFYLAEKKGWSSKELSLLFFDSFFCPQSLAWIFSSHHSQQSDAFMKCMKSLSSDQLKTRKLFSALISSNHIFTLSSSFCEMEQQCYKALITHFDVAILVSCLSSVGKLPYGMSCSDFNFYSDERRYLPFFVKIYPKKKVFKHQTLSIFENSSENLKFFENYLCLLETQKNMKRMLSLSEYISSILMAPIAVKISNFSLQYCDDGSFASFKQARNWLPQKELQLRQFICASENAMRRAFSDFSHELSLCEKKWNEVFNAAATKNPFLKMSKMRVEVVALATEDLENLNEPTLHQTFFSMTSILTKACAAGDEGLQMCLYVSRPKLFPKYLLIFSALVVHHLIGSTLLPDWMTELWSKMEGLIERTWDEYDPQNASMWRGLITMIQENEPMN